MRNQFKELIQSLFRDITTLGGSFFYGIMMLFVLGIGELELFYQLLLGFIATTGFVVLIRTFYFKDRPNKQHYSGFLERIDASSFPSLHATRVVFYSLVFINFFSNSFITAWFFILMILVVYSRIYLKKHDWIDIIGGILLGLMVFWISTILF